MKLDKRVLLGSLCAVAALAIVTFKYIPDRLTKEIAPPPKQGARPLIQDYAATQPAKISSADRSSGG
jgi:hypothetical protein